MKHVVFLFVLGLAVMGAHRAYAIDPIVTGGK